MTEKAVVSKPETSLVSLSETRLPYHPDLKKNLGISKMDWIAIIDTVFPKAQDPKVIITAIAYCQARKLDILKKVVHIVPVWDSDKGKLVDMVWPSIAELRITAFRTGKFAGLSEIELGPVIEKKIGTWSGRFPEWGRKTVKRIIEGQLYEFPGPKVYWLEIYAKKKKTDITPNERWQRAPFSQHEKCVDAAALRAAFPEEIGDYAAEEMEGQVLYSNPMTDAEIVDVQTEQPKSTAEMLKKAQEEKLSKEAKGETPEQSNTEQTEKEKTLEVKNEEQPKEEMPKSKPSTENTSQGPVAKKTDSDEKEGPGVNEVELLASLKRRIIVRIKNLSSQNKVKEIEEVRKQTGMPQMIPDIDNVDFAQLILDKLNEI